MSKSIVVLGIAVVAAYVAGSQSAKSRGKNYEDLRHQIERLWSDPHARQARRELARKASKAMKSARRTVRRKLS
ncbi:MAG TPA: hypothetical protein VGC18_14425 [Lacisediminihabitans sp.]|uniref:hypothetical protein n=1 Tax=Lacisediminihabitans sp. TaxID=2787631 RepID=UPI002ED8F4C8